MKPRTNSVVALLGVALLTAGLAACSSTSSASPEATASCDGPPTLANDTPTVALLLQNGLPADEYAVDIEAVVHSATERNARLLVNSIGGATDAESLLANVLLKGEGDNSFQRKNDLTCKKTTVDAAVTTVSSAPVPESLDVFSSLMTLQGNLGGTSSDAPVDVVLLSSMLSNGSPSLADPAQLADPTTVLNTLASQQLKPDCTGWNFYMVEDSGADAATDAQLREFWRQYAEWCGGQVVAWTEHLADYPGAREAIDAADTALISITRTPTTVTAELSGDVLFDPGSHALRDGATADLLQVLELVGHGTGTVLVTGYTDVGGDEVNNVALATRRSETIEAWLIGKGVDPGRIDAVGAGSAGAVYPIPQSDDERQANRRVVVVIETA